MPSRIPNFRLTHGQVAWAIAQGNDPSKVLLDQLRYLRQLGVPFEASELGSGRGNRIRYGFDHLIELGVAVFGLKRGMRPREVATVLTTFRKRLRKIYRSAFLAQPENALEEDWVKSRGRIIPFYLDDYSFSLNDRFSDSPGTYQLVKPGEHVDGALAWDVVERYPGDKTRTIVPTTALVLELVAWAKEAPEIKPGPS